MAISAANFDLLLRAGRSFDDYFRYLDEQNYIDAQAGLLQPEQVETLPEADAAAEAADTTDTTDTTNEANESNKTNKTNTPDRPNKPSPTPAPAPIPEPGDGGSEGDDPLLD